MDIAALQAFVAVAEAGSFSQASERLYLTQPAISKRIALLESELDTRLFDRIGRTITLTESGHALLPRARHILLEVEDSRRVISRFKDDLKATVCGYFNTSCIGRLGTKRKRGMFTLR